MPYIIFNQDSDLDVKKLRFRRYKNIWDMRYKEEEEQRSQSIYIQTPPLRVSLVEEDQYYYYLICRLNNNDERFWDLIQNLDMATIEEMSEDCTSWGFREDTPLTFIEKRFIPTLKMSSINYEYSLHLIIPKNDDIKIYDQSGAPVSVADIHREFRIAMILLLDGVEFKNNYFSLKFVVEQMKVRIPDDYVKPTEESEEEPEEEEEEEPEPEEEKCLLYDSGDENQSYYNPEATKYSNHPRLDLYEYGVDEDTSRPEEQPNEEDAEDEAEDEADQAEDEADQAEDDVDQAEDDVDQAEDEAEDAQAEEVTPAEEEKPRSRSRSRRTNRSEKPRSRSRSRKTNRSEKPRSRSRSRKTNRSEKPRSRSRSQSERR